MLTYKVSVIYKYKFVNLTVRTYGLSMFSGISNWEPRMVFFTSYMTSPRAVHMYGCGFSTWTVDCNATLRAASAHGE